jgi:hypothetical protein
MKNANSPAMPAKAMFTSDGKVHDFQCGDNAQFCFPGMTKREMIAMNAMQGLLSDPNYVELYDTPEEWRKNIVEASVEFADALLAELDK